MHHPIIPIPSPAVAVLIIAAQSYRRKDMYATMLWFVFFGTMRCVKRYCRSTALQYQVYEEVPYVVPRILDFGEEQQARMTSDMRMERVAVLERTQRSPDQSLI